MKNQKHVQNGMLWNIGNDKKVKFYSDYWLNGVGCLLNHKQGIILKEDYNLKVSNLVTTNRFYDQTTLFDKLSVQISSCLATIVPPSSNASSNMLKWKYLMNRKFIIKSTHDAFEGMHGDQDAMDDI